MRRRSRECALQILYQLDVHGSLQPGEAQKPHIISQSMVAYWDSFVSDIPVDQEFAERLVRGVVANLDALDAAITAASQRWKTYRMNKVDLALMRICAYEIL